MKQTVPTLNFNDISHDTFLAEYWQKQPILLKQALPGFQNVLTPEELAGLSLEPDVESRIVIEHTGHQSKWELRRGPFDEQDYAQLPQTHWTLLVQGVDRLLAQVQTLLDYFDFIPQWRVDDVMISYAPLHGSVGPHYDNYDVFLLQALGQRKWMLTTQDCFEQNFLPDVPLRVMKTFNIEQEFIVEPGDILYLPPHVAHHGVSLSDHCMTYSFGYRSYQSLEMLNSFCDYLNEHGVISTLYQDPDWRTIEHTAQLPDAAWLQAKKLLLSQLADDQAVKNWFGEFATQLDQKAEEQLPEALEDVDETDFIALLEQNEYIYRDPTCKMAYRGDNHQDSLQLFINGVSWQVVGVHTELIELVCNHRSIACHTLKQHLQSSENTLFLLELWKLQWLHF